VGKKNGGMLGSLHGHTPRIWLTFALISGRVEEVVRGEPEGVEMMITKQYQRVNEAWSDIPNNERSPATMENGGKGNTGLKKMRNN